MPRVGFELTILVFERTKTVHFLDRAATVIDFSQDTLKLNNGSSFVTRHMTHDYGAC
jgi:hypothetical protein